MAASVGTGPVETAQAVPTNNRTRLPASRVIRRIGLYLLLVAIGVVFVLPFVVLLSTALKPGHQDVFSNPPDLIPRPPIVDAFVRAWTTIEFPRYLLNSFLLIVLIVPANVVISALTAYPLATMRFRGRTLIFFGLVAAMFLPMEVMLIPQYLIVNQLGLVNTYAGVVLPNLLTVFAIFLLRQAFTSVPRELADAARIDGCNEWRVFWHVMLPVTRPTLAIVAIFGFINVWNDFLWPLVVLSDQNLYPVSLGVAYLKGIGGVDLRLMSAGTVISVIPIIVFFLILQRQIMEAAKGAVKG
ncbi:carbohydrate ABC transporter permease [Actinopolymorpha alba]|uniref:carbohydrate ABC transporter permease n=1 Tax=Actinopolymorpha alba TaxID=533267 RepID=UPI0003829881|nr:carbohydrate ABC transporter permease [Actinopolymorpha alba]